jgi:hypothetical protein
MTGTEFYERRDDRTSRIVSQRSYRHARVSISINPSAALSFGHQVTFVLAANLTARWARHVRIADVQVAVDPRLIRPDAPRTLADFAVFVARSADPFGDFEVSDVAGQGSLRLHVGSAPPSGAYPVVGDGWVARAGMEVAVLQDQQNPLGAALAATLGVAHLFEGAVGFAQTREPISLSLWNLRGGTHAEQGPRLDFPDLGDVLVVGCGAVGSAIAWLLPLVGCSGRWTLVDGDVVDVSNLNRSPLFGSGDVSKAKAHVVSSYLRASGIETLTVDRWFDEALKDRLLPVRRPDIVVPVANDRNVRHLIQHQVPPVQIYGTTGRNWDAFLGRHIPGQEDCLACRFPAKPEEPMFACAMGALPTVDVDATKAPDAALPFLPTAAAAMAVAELAKLRHQEFPINENFACLDFRGPRQDFVAVQRSPRPDCICRHQGGVWARINGETRFGRLSPPFRTARESTPR